MTLPVVRQNPGFCIRWNIVGLERIRSAPDLPSAIASLTDVVEVVCAAEYPSGAERSTWVRQQHEG